MSKSSASNPSSRATSKPKVVSPRRRAGSMPPGVNPLDHSIFHQNGSTSALEYTTHRLQAAKLEPDPDMVTLTREMGYLRQEIYFYRQCFEILQRVRENSY